MTVFLVALGAAVGAPLRYLTDRYVQARHPSPFPWGTLAVNIAGSFLIGLVMVLLLKTGEWRENFRLLLVTGIMGGFTTFSSFSWETWMLFEEGKVPLALANIGVSLAVCLMATAAGAMLARQF